VTKQKVSSNINVTPMVDVMLVLLIIFMVITPMLQNKVQIDMAKVDNPLPCRTPTRKTPLSWRSPAMAVCSWGKTKVAQRAWRPGPRKAGRQARQDDLCSRRCARAVPGG
jgi:biopolymer transport protein ExbD